MSDYQIFKELLDSYVNINFSNKKKEKVTFFDVTGYPHYENVASNILKFLFDTGEEHNFGDLWLRSLVNVYISKAKQINIQSLDVRNIIREYSFEKRVDLLIDARPLIIVIENKIRASVYNPFNIYSEMANNYIKDNRISNPEIMKIVLSVSKEELDPSTEFINITYDELFDDVEKNWQNYSPDDKWRLFAEEFIANLRKKKGDTRMKLDKKWITFVNENGESIANLFNKIQSDLEERVSVLRKLNDELSDIQFKRGVYNSNDAFYSSQYVNIKLKDGATICFETYLMKITTKKQYEDFDKLYISLWCRGNKQYDFSDVLKTIKKEKTAKERTTTGRGAWGKHYILDEIILYKDFSIPDIANKIRNYLENASKLC